jgi:DNA repair protein RecO (recombination protein O)
MAINSVENKRQRSIKVEAIVLRHTEWGEADRMLSLFSRELGKLQAIAKGVRKIHSRKAGHLEPFTRVNLLLAKGRDLWIVTQAETLDAYMPLRTGMAGVVYASYAVELLDRFTFEEGETLPLYKLLQDTLTRLSAEADLDFVVRYFEVRLLDHVGFRPQLFQCLGCGKEIQAEDQYFSAQAGGVLCPKCGASTVGASPISMQALKLLRHFQRSSYSEAKRLDLTPQINREVEAISGHYLTFLLERGLNTPPFIRKLKSYKASEAL